LFLSVYILIVSKENVMYTVLRELGYP
jgi:hypothetical protein